MKKAIIITSLILALSLAILPFGAFAAEGGLTIKEIDDKYIYGVPERATLSQFGSAYQRANFVMTTVNGSTVVDDKTFIGTGFGVKYESSVGEYKTLTIIVLGDIDGNGRVTSGDYLNIRAHLKNTSTLKDAKLLAADINGDGATSTFDYMFVKAHFSGTYDIYQNQKMPDTSVAPSSEDPTEDPWTSGWA